MRTKIKLGLGMMATGLLLLPLGAGAQSQMDAMQPPAQGHADSDRWVAPQTGTSGSTRQDSSRNARNENAVQTSSDLQRSSQGRTQNISARFEERVGDNCQYRGTVRGTVREVNVRGATADNANQVTPDLRIQAELSCQDGSARHTVTASLRGPQYAREGLAQAIQERARIFTSRDGQVCSYAPRLAFDNGRVASNGIAQSCMTAARGGGPGNADDQSNSLLRTPNTVDTQQQQNVPSGSMMQAPGNTMQDNGAQQMPSMGGGPGVQGSDVQQGQPAVDDTLNRGTQQQMDTTGTGRDIAPSTNDGAQPDAPIRQMK